jgi:UDP-2,4-diacetamido-2,4,6-trideoxy-beta-L-altropyranose hydrolase
VAARPADGHQHRVAFRCDGDERSGAGHVGRCVPLAQALAARGWPPLFVGSYSGVAAWLLDRAGLDAVPADPSAPCGVAPARFAAAVVDSYAIPDEEICMLAALRPLATLAEANRCASSGVVVEYHVDAKDHEGPRLLAGPRFAPLDPAFAGAGRAGAQIATVLLTVGGSSLGAQRLEQMLPSVAAAFPEARLLLGGEAPRGVPGTERVDVLPSPAPLTEVVADVDVAVTAAGFTAYELACAGVPMAAVAIVENQRRVVRGLRGRGLAPCLDLAGGEPLAGLPGVLAELEDASARQRLAELGMATFDGRGAQRSATALAERFAATAGAPDASGAGAGDSAS